MAAPALLKYTAYRGMALSRSRLQECDEKHGVVAVNATGIFAGDPMVSLVLGNRRGVRDVLHRGSTRPIIVILRSTVLQPGRGHLGGDDLVD